MHELPSTPISTPTSATSGRDPAAERKEGNAYLGYGLGIGALGVVSGVVGAAVCPICVVATPVLLTAGIVKRVQARRLEAGASAPTKEE